MNALKTILFVEDDADDRDLLMETIKDINDPINAVFAEDGLKAIQYLSDKSKLPCLVVLDLNMPYLDGKATYWKIKNELHLDKLPVIVYSSSQSPHDKSLFHNLGVEFITKPDSMTYMKKIVQHMITVCNSNIDC